MFSRRSNEISSAVGFAPPHLEIRRRRRNGRSLGIAAFVNRRVPKRDGSSRVVSTVGVTDGVGHRRLGHHSAKARTQRRRIGEVAIFMVRSLEMSWWLTRRPRDLFELRSAAVSDTSPVFIFPCRDETAAGGRRGDARAARGLEKVSRGCARAGASSFVTSRKRERGGDESATSRCFAFVPTTCRASRVRRHQTSSRALRSR